MSGAGRQDVACNDMQLNHKILTNHCHIQRLTHIPTRPTHSKAPSTAFIRRRWRPNARVAQRKSSCRRPTGHETVGLSGATGEHATPPRLDHYSDDIPTPALSSPALFTHPLHARPSDRPLSDYGVPDDNPDFVPLAINRFAGGICINTGECEPITPPKVSGSNVHEHKFILSGFRRPPIPPTAS